MKGPLITTSAEIDAAKSANGRLVSAPASSAGNRKIMARPSAWPWLAGWPMAWKTSASSARSASTCTRTRRWKWRRHSVPASIASAMPR
ncbi:hypothetical protein D9M70_518670 [compost metagenome]